MAAVQSKANLMRIYLNGLGLTFFQRFGFRARQEQAATNQQFPTTPWFRS